MRRIPVGDRLCGLDHENHVRHIRSSSYLGIDARDFAPQDVHVRVLALRAALLLAMHAQGAVALLGADAAPFHGLAAGRVRQFARDFDVQLQETLQGHVGREGLHAL